MFLSRVLWDLVFIMFFYMVCFVSMWVVCDWLVVSFYLLDLNWKVSWVFDFRISKGIILILKFNVKKYIEI